ncbi:hypothetical protein [Spirochaeta cellobiosiphila]|uniref:hypothetical protein n=1 Tax=Spirochaeta cellobiosiphila TaxID=504483 RepID=UPI0004029302|nr:hypothetical protein [Spirochaeta cellobiosiphila]
MNVSAYPLMYKSIQFSQSGKVHKMSLPVNWTELPYSNLKYVVGYPALSKGQGYSLKDLAQLDRKILLTRVSGSSKRIEEARAITKEIKPIRQYKNIKTQPEASSVRLFTGKLNPPPQILDFSI